MGRPAVSSVAALDDLPECLAQKEAIGAPEAL